MVTVCQNIKVVVLWISKSGFKMAFAGSETLCATMWIGKFIQVSFTLTSVLYSFAWTRTYEDFFFSFFPCLSADLDLFLSICHCNHAGQVLLSCLGQHCPSPVQHWTLLATVRELWLFPRTWLRFWCFGWMKQGLKPLLMFFFFNMADDNRQQLWAENFPVSVMEGQTEQF